MPPILPPGNLSLQSLSLGNLPAHLLQSLGAARTPPPAEAPAATQQGGVLLSGNLPALLQQGLPGGRATIPLPQTPDLPGGQTALATGNDTSRTGGRATDMAGRLEGTIGLPPGSSFSGLAAASDVALPHIRQRTVTTVVAAADIPARLPPQRPHPPQGAGFAAKAVASTSLKLLLASSALLLLLHLLGAS